MGRNITVEAMRDAPVEEHRVELVERKGVGHPDTICDSIMDRISVELSKIYLKKFGAIMHHNIDKGLLVAGGVEHRFGGGEVTAPMRLVFGDRATFEAGGERVPVEEIAVATAKKWLKESLRFVDPDEHMVYQVELKPGSAELTDIFKRKGRVLGANDTSAAVGYAPLTPTEKIVLATEKHMNSRGFKKKFPETGEDIKVMGMRRNGELRLTIACPFMEKYVENEADYFRKKMEVTDAVKEFVEEKATGFEKTSIDINTLDARGRGVHGVYLSLLGTSAEDADCGQVGRGNRVNGVIALNRPMGTEAAAGKNPVSHVGKIYNVLTHRIAGEIHKQVPGVRQVYVWLCSQIGKPVDQPKIAAAQLVLRPGTRLEEVSKEVVEVIDKELGHINKFCMELAQGKIPVC